MGRISRVCNRRERELCVCVIKTSLEALEGEGVNKFGKVWYIIKVGSRIVCKCNQSWHIVSVDMEDGGS